MVKIYFEIISSSLIWLIQLKTLQNSWLKFGKIAQNQDQFYLESPGHVSTVRGSGGEAVEVTDNNRKFLQKIFINYSQQIKPKFSKKFHKKIKPIMLYIFAPKSIKSFEIYILVDYG